MKTRQNKTKNKDNVKPNKVGPWASVSENQAKVVRNEVRGIAAIAIDGKYETDVDKMSVDEAIESLSQIAASAMICLLVLNPTRSKRNGKPGPFANIHAKEVKSIRDMLEEVQRTSVGGVQSAKRIKRFNCSDFFGYFSTLKKLGLELEGSICPDDDGQSIE